MLPAPAQTALDTLRALAGAAEAPLDHPPAANPLTLDPNNTQDATYRDSFILRVRTLVAARNAADPQTLFEAAAPLLGNLETTASAHALVELARGLAPLLANELRTRHAMICAHACAQLLLHAGDRAQAEHLWSALARAAEAQHDPYGTLLTHVPPVLLALIDGRLEDCIEAAEVLIARGDHLGIPGLARQFAAPADEARMLLGRETAAIARVGAAWRTLAAPEPAYERSRRALYLARAGQLDEAKVAFAAFGVPSAASGDSGSLPPPPSRGRIKEGVPSDDDLPYAPAAHVVHLLGVAIFLRDIEATTALPRVLTPCAGLALLGTATVLPSRILGHAAQALAEFGQARLHYIDALATGARITHRPELALTHLALAELLRDDYAHDPNEVRHHLDAAMVEFGAMNMQPAFERALQLEARLAI